MNFKSYSFGPFYPAQSQHKGVCVWGGALARPHFLKRTPKGAPHFLDNLNVYWFKEFLSKMPFNTDILKKFSLLSG